MPPGGSQELSGGVLFPTHASTMPSDTAAPKPKRTRRASANRTKSVQKAIADLAPPSTLPPEAPAGAPQEPLSAPEEPTQDPPTTRPSLSEQGTAERLKGDFRVFLWAIWKYLGLPSPTPVQYDIALYLHHGPRRRIIQAFRGVGKTWITAAYVIWRLYRDPDLKIMVVSASKSRADEISTFMLRLVHEVPFLTHLAPRPEQHSSKIIFDVGPARTSKDPSVKSVGITGQITGSRADIIIPDDVEVPNNSMTQGQRDKLATLVTEFDAVIKPGGEIIYLGTPQTEQSLYLTLTSRGYATRIWPARVPDKSKVTGTYGAALAPFILNLIAEGVPTGATVDPKRFTDEDLAEREASYGRSGFALQFMLDTSLSDANRYPLRLQDLMVMALDLERGPATLAWGSSPELVLSHHAQVGLNGDRWLRPAFVSPEYTPYTGKVMAIDPSGRGKDETAWAVLYFLHGYLFLMGVGGYLDGYGENTLRALAQTAKAFKVNQIVVESNYGDGMFTKLLTPYLARTWPVSVEEVTSRGMKEARIIDTLEPVIAQHKLVVNEAAVAADLNSGQYADMEYDRQMRYKLFYQLTRITSEKGALLQDDRVDVLHLAVKYFVDQMEADHERMVQATADDALQRELDRFLDHAIGGDPSRSMNSLHEYLGKSL